MFSFTNRDPAKNCSKLSKRKAMCHWKDESGEKKAERTLFRAFVPGLDGSQSISFGHLSGCNSSDRYFVQKFNAFVDTEHPVLVSGSCPKPDPAQLPRQWH